MARCVICRKDSHRRLITCTNKGVASLLAACDPGNKSRLRIELNRKVREGVSIRVHESCRRFIKRKSVTASASSTIVRPHIQDEAKQKFSYNRCCFICGEDARTSGKGTLVFHASAETLKKTLMKIAADRKDELGTAVKIRLKDISQKAVYHISCYDTFQIIPGTLVKQKHPSVSCSNAICTSKGDLKLRNAFVKLERIHMDNHHLSGAVASRNLHKDHKLKDAVVLLKRIDVQEELMRMKLEKRDISVLSKFKGNVVVRHPNLELFKHSNRDQTLRGWRKQRIGTQQVSQLREELHGLSHSDMRLQEKLFHQVRILREELQGLSHPDKSLEEKLSKHSIDQEPSEKLDLSSLGTACSGSLLNTGKEYWYSCGMCDNYFKNKLYFKEHMKQHFSVPHLKQLIDNVYPFSCELCSHKFINRSSFTEHMQSHRCSVKKERKSSLINNKRKSLTHYRKEDNRESTYENYPVDCPSSTDQESDTFPYTTSANELSHASSFAKEYHHNKKSLGHFLENELDVNLDPHFDKTQEEQGEVMVLCNTDAVKDADCIERDDTNSDVDEQRGDIYIIEEEEEAPLSLEMPLALEIHTEDPLFTLTSGDPISLDLIANDLMTHH